MADHEHGHGPDDEHEHLDEDEIEITINPRDEDLTALGVSPEEFESALMATLEAYDRAIDVDDPDATTPLEEAEITLAGKAYHLREVADIEITGGLEGLGDDGGHTLDEGDDEAVDVE